MGVDLLIRSAQILKASWNKNAIGSSGLSHKSGRAQQAYANSAVLRVILNSTFLMLQTRRIQFIVPNNIARCLGVVLGFSFPSGNHSSGDGFYYYFFEVMLIVSCRWGCFVRECI